MAKFTMTVESEAAAYVEDADGEICAALIRVGQRIRDGWTDGPVLDTNGRTVGSWEWEA